MSSDEENEQDTDEEIPQENEEEDSIIEDVSSHDIWKGKEYKKQRHEHVTNFLFLEMLRNADR